MRFHNLQTLVELERDFGPAVEPWPGEYHRRVLAETTAVVAYQWRHGVRRSGVKGFFLAGPPGTGKTTLARRAAYELALAFPAGDGPDGGVVLVLVDGGDVARARYGESEERIRELFARAEQGFTAPGQRAVLLFDDVESILMRRGADHAKEWHFSQDSVFFHAVDELDSGRVAVFLTSNRPDLVDEAILDRFLGYTFPVPDADLLLEVARRRADEHKFTAEQRAALLAAVRRDAEAGALRSLREVERSVVRQYVRDLLAADGHGPGGGDG